MYLAFFISWKITGEKFKGGMTMAPTATMVNDLLSTLGPSVEDIINFR